jgi:hypothetical protein
VSYLAVSEFYVRPERDAARSGVLVGAAESGRGEAGCALSERRVVEGVQLGRFTSNVRTFAGWMRAMPTERCGDLQRSRTASRRSCVMGAIVFSRPHKKCHVVPSPTDHDYLRGLYTLKYIVGSGLRQPDGNRTIRRWRVVASFPE